VKYKQLLRQESTAAKSTLHHTGVTHQATPTRLPVRLRRSTVNELLYDNDSSSYKQNLDSGSQAGWIHFNAWERVSLKPNLITAPPPPQSSYSSPHSCCSFEAYSGVEQRWWVLWRWEPQSDLQRMSDLSDLPSLWSSGCWHSARTFLSRPCWTVSQNGTKTSAQNRFHGTPRHVNSVL
jgi:hypothetical protein